MTGLQEAIPFVIICDFFIDFYAIKDDSEITGKNYVLNSPFLPNESTVKTSNNS